MEDINQYKEKRYKNKTLRLLLLLHLPFSLSLSEHREAEIGDGQSGAPRENGQRAQVPHLVTLSIPKHSDDMCFVIISLMKKNPVFG